jgi:hypothetical protein
MKKIFKKSMLKDLIPRLLNISLKNNRINKSSIEYKYLSYGIDKIFYGLIIKLFILNSSKLNLRLFNKALYIFKISNLNNKIKEQKK